MNHLYRDKRNGRIVVIEKFLNKTIVKVRDLGRHRDPYITDISNLQRADISTKNDETVD